MVSVGECCCHFWGVLATVLGTGGLVAGLILLIIYDKGTTLYWVAIGGLSGGAAFAVLVIVYACAINRHHWRLYGCINLKMTRKKLARTLQMMPSKAEVDTEGSDLHGGNLHSGSLHGGDMSDNRASKTSLDWDPDTVLPD